MWTRGELKTKAKGSLKANYWKAVLVALLVMTIGGGTSAATSASGASSQIAGGITALRSTPTTDTSTVYDYDYDYDDVLDGTYGDQSVVWPDDAETLGGQTVSDTVSNDLLLSDDTLLSDEAAASIRVAVIALLSVFVIVLALAIMTSAFVFNPLLVGSSRFFLRDLNQPAQVSEVGHAFDNNYREVVKTMFLRDLYTVLWSLLLVVPGIIKAYEYRMIPYLLADDPSMTKSQAFTESKRMMSGQKWRAFVLDLSFIGWDLLSVLTLGILTVFYVGPYKNLTNAALYERLHYGGQDGRALNAASLSPEGAPAHASQLPVPPQVDADSSETV